MGERQPADARGFTFIELTVVIGIIAVLAAILFPVFARAREKARQARCLANLEQIGLALSMYARDHAGHFPPTNDDLSPLLGRYLPMGEVLTCPSASYEREGRAKEVPPAGVRVPPLPDFDYYYRAGFCDDDDPNTLLVCDTGLDRHNGGADCLFADGHAKWLNRSPSRSWTWPIPYPLDTIAKERGLPTETPPQVGGDSP